MKFIAKEYRLSDGSAAASVYAQEETAFTEGGDLVEVWAAPSYESARILRDVLTVVRQRFVECGSERAVRDLAKAIVSALDAV